MSYIGRLTKNELAVLMEEQIKPFLEESKALRLEVSALKKELANKAKELWTIEEVADFFAITTASVHNWIKEEKLIPYKIGGRTYFKKVDIDRLVDLSKQKKK